MSLFFLLVIALHFAANLIFDNILALKAYWSAQNKKTKDVLRKVSFHLRSKLSWTKDIKITKLLNIEGLMILLQEKVHR